MQWPYLIFSTTPGSNKLIAFSLQLFFQNKAISEEEAFVLFVRKNALQVLIPKYGLEGTVFMDKTAATGFVFNEQVKNHYCFYRT